MSWCLSAGSLVLAICFRLCRPSMVRSAVSCIALSRSDAMVRRRSTSRVATTATGASICAFRKYSDAWRRCIDAEGGVRGMSSGGGSSPSKTATIASTSVYGRPYGPSASSTTVSAPPCGASSTASREKIFMVAKYPHRRWHGEGRLASRLEEGRPRPSLGRGPHIST